MQEYIWVLCEELDPAESFDETRATLYLNNGFQMRGTITGFDSFVIVLVTDGRQQMIYKHSISTIAPIRPLKAAQ